MNHTQTAQQDNTPKPLSRNPSRAMQEMMDTIDSLRGIYLRETEALESTDNNTFLSLQDEKLQAAKEYEARVNEMLARQKEMKEADPKLRSKLEDMQKDFSSLAQRNMEALKRMQRTMERISTRLRNTAKEELKKHRSVSYGSTGEVYHDEKKAISTGIVETA